MKETEIDESEECSVELNKSVHYTKINFSGNLEGKGGRREGEGREKGGRKWKECSLSFKIFYFLWELVWSEPCYSLSLNLYLIINTFY